MIFYSPILDPELPVQSNSWINTRLERYHHAVMHCLSSARQQAIMNLSKLAVCVMETYPDGLAVKSTQLVKLRGVAMVLGSAPGSSEAMGYGAALPGGKIVLNCIPASLQASGYQLCHAALFSSVEYDDLASKRTRLKMRRKSPISG